MTEDRSKYALSPEVLSSIKSFSGQDESAGERLLRDGMAVQKVHTPYSTAVAVQRPRSLTRVTANVLEEAKLAGSAFFYRWKVKNKRTGREDIIQGPSIDLAMCMARNYGNCAIDVEDEETIADYKFKGIFVDLENGFTCPRLFKQRKKQEIGMDDEGRAGDIVYQIGQSKAIRNAIVRAMPNWLSEQAIEEATKAEIAKIKPENIAIARARAFEYFRQYGIDQPRIETKIGRPMDLWTAQDIVDLKGMATALKEGRISGNELFPLPEGEAKPETKPPVPDKGRKKAPATTEEVKQETVNGTVVELAPGACPDTGDTMTKDYCNKTCKKRIGCSVWAD